MDAVAHARFQRFGRRKVAQVLSQVRGKTVGRAKELLPNVPRRSAGMVEKTIRSAAANLMVKAGHELDLQSMWVKAGWVDKGPLKNLRRLRPGPQGRALSYRRKMCHLTIVVSDKK